MASAISVVCPRGVESAAPRGLVVAGSHLAPTVPLPAVFLYSVVRVVAGGAVLLVAIVVSLTVSQWVLRHGGTDAQWFWFSGEPPGLQKLRAEAQAKKNGL